MSKPTPTSAFPLPSLRALRAKAVRHADDFAQTVPLMTLEALVSAKIRSGDPYSLRWNRKQPPKVAFQLEYDAGVALYAAFDSKGLNSYAEALRRCWSFFGIARRDRVGIFDYGTSPVSYLASSTFTPYLGRGAADVIGCLPICNDGAANLSRRAVDIVRFVRPRVLFVRTDCLHPFAAEITRLALPLSSYVEFLVAVENEAVLSRGQRDSFQTTLGVPIYRLVRADVAMFLAPECRHCGMFHIWRDLYHVETTEGDDQAASRQPGRLVITNWLAGSCAAVRYLSQINATLDLGSCRAGARDVRMSA